MLSVNRLVQNFYFHIPFCVKKCYFCAFPVHAVGSKSNPGEKHKLYEEYCQTIEKQIKTVLSNSASLCNNIESLYFGGGTPSLLQGSQIKSIISNFKSGLRGETEVTLQMNLQEVRKAEQFINQGVNRISVGIQSLNQKTLQMLNRGYESPHSLPKSELKGSLRALSESVNLNLDFIVDFNSRAKETEQLVEFISYVKPKHVSLYMLEINEGSYLQKHPNKFINKLGNNQNYEQLSNSLSRQLGYQHYEVSNYCLPGFRSKHNTAYWMGNKPFGAFGMGATSLLNSHRITRPRNLSKYYNYVNSLDNNLTSDSQILQIHPETEAHQQAKWVILSRLRRKEGLSWRQLKQCLRLEKEDWEVRKEKCKKLIEGINQQMEDIVDMGELEAGVKVKGPKGYLIVDQISYRIIECLQL